MRRFIQWGLIIVMLGLFSCKSDSDLEKEWYKGNTHTHTTLSDGNASPDYVINWYHDRGYNFLVLTDHNYFIDPDTVLMPKNRRDDFILIPGEEVTGKRAIHSTGLNVRGYVHPGGELNSKTEVIQSHVDSIRAANGIPIYNHPNFGSGAQVSDIFPVENLHFIELYNGHPSVNNFGFIGENYSHIPVEAKWDSLLTLGMKLYGVACDDAHHYDEFYDKRANPGRGWIMVHSPGLNADSIVSAMQRGDFYASIGVILKTVQYRDDVFTVEIDLEATKVELRSAYLMGNVIEGGLLGIRALMGGRKYSAAATALEDSLVCYINQETFCKITTKHPDISHCLLTLICSLLAEAEEKMTSMAQKPVRERLAEGLLVIDSIFNSKGGCRPPPHGHTISLSREDLANIVGTATETVIRTAFQEICL